jgi:hypothetical protein
MTEKELRRLARIGAEARLGELQREIEAIQSAFPDLRSGQLRQPSTSASGKGRKRRRRRRRMSAAAKKAVSVAQKKRWAEWRKKQESVVRQGASKTDTEGVSHKKR